MCVCVCVSGCDSIKITAESVQVVHMRMHYFYKMLYCNCMRETMCNVFSWPSTRLPFSQPHSLIWFLTHAFPTDKLGEF